jgi:hypothetical protein
MFPLNIHPPLLFSLFWLIGSWKKILTNLNHGFRSGYSCETQLITTINDFLQEHDKGQQVDIASTDVSFEHSPSTIVLIVLVDRKLVSHEWMFPLLPYCSSLCRSLSCGTVSNALEKSKMATTMFFGYWKTTQRLERCKHLEYLQKMRQTPTRKLQASITNISHLQNTRTHYL